MRLLDGLLIARKDLSIMLRERETLMWVFVMPIVFFYFIGNVTGGLGGTSDRKDKLVLEQPESAGFLADQIARRLEQLDYEVERRQGDTDADAAPEDNARRVILPENFTSLTLDGVSTTVELLTKSGGIGGDYHKFRVGRAVYSVLADILASTEAGEQPDAEAFARLDERPRTLAIRVESAGERVEIPSGYEQTIPGTMVMFTLIIMLTAGAVLLVIERNQGLLRRLASTPLSRSSVVFGKWGGKVSLGMIQIAFAMLAGTFLFDMDWGPDLAMVTVVLLGWCALCASLGLLLGCLVRTEGQAVGVGVLASNVLAALGGCWWPIEITPSWMQSLARLLPTGWTMDAMHKLINFQAGAASAIPHVLGLFAAAWVVGWIAARRFRFD
ncbi:MAG: ABC-2 type transport system permease protein [Chlamydiales bacterium]|jgi:ABC-2 type transport system permease protein